MENRALIESVADAVLRVLEGRTGELCGQLQRYLSLKDLGNLPRNAWAYEFAQRLAPRLWKAREYNWLKKFYLEILSQPVQHTTLYYLVAAYIWSAPWNADPPKEYGIFPIPKEVEGDFGSDSKERLARAPFPSEKDFLVWKLGSGFCFSSTTIGEDQDTQKVIDTGVVLSIVKRLIALGDESWKDLVGKIIRNYEKEIARLSSSVQERRKEVETYAPAYLKNRLALDEERVTTAKNSLAYFRGALSQVGFDEQ